MPSPGPPAVDLNADVGEAFGAYAMGDDGALLPFVTSVNVACGFHGGEPLADDADEWFPVAHGFKDEDGSLWLAPTEERSS